MKIVVLADSRKNELLVNFCIAYKQILGRHELMSVSHNVRLLEQATGLRLNGIATDVTGAMNQIAARAEFNEIDAVIFLRDPGAAAVFHYDNFPVGLSPHYLYFPYP